MLLIGMAFYGTLTLIRSASPNDSFLHATTNFHPVLTFADDGALADQCRRHPC